MAQETTPDIQALKELHERITKDIDKAPVWYFSEGWYLKNEMILNSIKK